MSDTVFNTLMAVALMCGQHMSGGTLSDDFIPDPGHATWEAGFERCEKVVTAVAMERMRREALEAQKKDADEKARLANAIAAIDGRKFTPEPAPKPLVNRYSCIVPTGNIDLNVRSPAR